MRGSSVEPRRTVACGWFVRPTRILDRAGINDGTGELHCPGFARRIGFLHRDHGGHCSDYWGLCIARGLRLARGAIVRPHDTGID